MGHAPVTADDQSKAGFVQCQYDIHFALLGALGGTKGLVMAAIVRDQLGAGKRADGAVPVEEIAEVTGIHPDSVREAIRRLVKQGMLDKVAPGRFPL